MRQNTWPICLSYWVSCRAVDVRRFCNDYRKSPLVVLATQNAPSYHTQGNQTRAFHEGSSIGRSCLSVTLVVLGIIRRLLFPSFPLRSDKHESDGLPHPVHQQHETFHRDTVQHPSVPSIYSVIDYCLVNYTIFCSEGLSAVVLKSENEMKTWAKLFPAVPQFVLHEPGTCFHTVSSWKWPLLLCFSRCSILLSKKQGSPICLPVTLGVF
jgi:hypothetical protein